jgi:hypothetical protein
MALAEGVCLYEAVSHRVTPVTAGDHRSWSGRGVAAAAPVNLFDFINRSG